MPLTYVLKGSAPSPIFQRIHLVNAKLNKPYHRYYSGKPEFSRRTQKSRKFVPPYTRVAELSFTNIRMF